MLPRDRPRQRGGCRGKDRGHPITAIREDLAAGDLDLPVQDPVVVAEIPCHGLRITLTAACARLDVGEQEGDGVVGLPTGIRPRGLHRVLPWWPVEFGTLVEDLLLQAA
jgi:hypothetical protein